MIGQKRAHFQTNQVADSKSEEELYETQEDPNYFQNPAKKRILKAIQR
jgi:uncharacterized protein (DUF427 family)